MKLWLNIRGKKMRKEVLASNYRAGIGEENGVKISGTTFGSLIRNLRKVAKIDCRSTHKEEVIFSEFRQGAYGIFYWNRHTGALSAWIEWE